MKKITVTLIMITIVSIAVGGAWNIDLKTAYHLSLSNYSDNWNGDDMSGITWTFDLQSSAEKDIGENYHFAEALKLSFGQTHVQDNLSREWAKPQKSSDIIDWETSLRWMAGLFVDPYTSFRFKSHFIDGSDPSNERFINPIEMTEALGLARVLAKTEASQHIARLGFGFRQTIDRDAIDPESDTKSTITTNDGGIDFSIESNAPVLNGAVDFESKFRMFTALMSSEDYDNDDWKYPDITWDNYFAAKISDLIDVKLDIQILYDREISKRASHKEILALGISWEPLITKGQ